MRRHGCCGPLARARTPLSSGSLQPGATLLRHPVMQRRAAAYLTCRPSLKVEVYV